MYIQVKAAKDDFKNRGWRSEIESLVKGTLGRFEDRITSVDVYISDESGHENDGEFDRRCVMEACVKGLQRIAVRCRAPYFDVAILDCAEKMELTLDRQFGPNAKGGYVSQAWDDLIAPSHGPLQESQSQE